VSWSMVSLAASSVGNFALVLVALRVDDPSTFGYFAIAFAAYTLALNLNRALTGSLLILRYSDAESYQRKVATSRYLLLSALFGMISGTVLVVSVWLLGTYSLVFLSMAVVLPPLLIVDTLRYWHFAGRNPKGAAVLDLLWSGLAAVAISALLSIGIHSSAAMVAAWGLCAGIATLPTVLWHTLWPRGARLATLLREGWRDRLQLSLETGAIALADLLVLSVISTVGAAAAAGDFRASSLVQAPLMIALSSAVVVAVPALISRVRSSDSKTVLLPLAGMSALGIMAGLAITAVFLALPTSVGASLFGGSWATIDGLIGTWALVMMAQAVAVGGFSGLRVFAQLGAASSVRLLCIPLFVAFAAVGTLLEGVEGAVVGYGLVTLGGGAAAWLVVLRTSRRLQVQEVDGKPVGDALK
jgi:O-antigen/teichoic acid export membrane protein